MNKRNQSSKNRGPNSLILWRNPNLQLLAKEQDCQGCKYLWLQSKKVQETLWPLNFPLAAHFLLMSGARLRVNMVGQPDATVQSVKKSG